MITDPKSKLTAKVTAYGNNCGFNCFAHFFINKILNLDEKSLDELFSRPEYKDLLKTFAEYYKIPKNIKFNHHSLKLLFEKYDNPIDREAIFGPVLRAHLSILLHERVDLLEKQWEIAPDDKAHDTFSEKLIWEAKERNFNENPGELTSPDDLYLLAEKFGIHFGYITGTEKLRYVTEKGEELIVHNTGNHWEFKTERVLTEHNKHYESVDSINQLLKLPGTTSQQIDAEARKSGAVFWGIFQGSSQSAIVGQHIRTQVVGTVAVENEKNKIIKKARKRISQFKNRLEWISSIKDREDKNEQAKDPVKQRWLEFEKEFIAKYKESPEAYLQRSIRKFRNCLKGILSFGNDTINADTLKAMKIRGSVLNVKNNETEKDVVGKIKELLQLQEKSSKADSVPASEITPKPVVTTVAQEVEHKLHAESETTNLRETQTDKEKTRLKELPPEPQNVGRKKTHPEIDKTAQKAGQPSYLYKHFEKQYEKSAVSFVQKFSSLTKIQSKEDAKTAFKKFEQEIISANLPEPSKQLSQQSRQDTQSLTQQTQQGTDQMHGSIDTEQHLNPFKGCNLAVGSDYEKGALLMNRNDGKQDEARWSVQPNDLTKTTSISTQAEDQNLYKFALLHAGSEKVIMEPYIGGNDSISRQKILKAMDAFRAAYKITGVELDIGEENRKLFDPGSKASDAEKELFTILSDYKNSQSYDDFLRENQGRVYGETTKSKVTVNLHPYP